MGKLMIHGDSATQTIETLGVHTGQSKSKVLGIPLVADKVGSLSEGDIATKRDLGVGEFTGNSILNLYSNGAFISVNNPLIKKSDSITIGNVIDITGMASFTDLLAPNGVNTYDGGFIAYVTFTNSATYQNRLCTFKYIVSR